MKISLFYMRRRTRNPEKSTLRLRNSYISSMVTMEEILYNKNMPIKRLDHISVVVDDLAAAVAFFTVLGMTPSGEASVEGPWVDRVNGIKGVQASIIMMKTPDGHGRL